VHIVVIDVGNTVLETMAGEETHRKRIPLVGCEPYAEPTAVVVFVKAPLTMRREDGLAVADHGIHLAIAQASVVIAEVIAACRDVPKIGPVVYRNIGTIALLWGSVIEIVHGWKPALYIGDQCETIRRTFFGRYVDNSAPSVRIVF